MRTTVGTAETGGSGAGALTSDLLITSSSAGGQTLLEAVRLTDGAPVTRQRRHATLYCPLVNQGLAISGNHATSGNEQIKSPLSALPGSCFFD
jgi:hypothetical protein